MHNPSRFIFKNHARATGVTASSAAAGYPASNLLNSDKAMTFRSTGKTVTLSGSFATSMVASGLVIAGTNLSPTATGRLRLWSDAAASVLARDVGVQLVCPAPAIELEGFTAAQAASAYAYGGGSDARLWFPETTFRAWTLELSDASNLAAYIEAGHLVLGQYWSPKYDIDSGAGVNLRNTDVQKRTAAGSLKSRAGIKYRELPLSLSDLTLADFKVLLRALRSLGKTHPFVCSLYPEDADTELDRDTLIVGKLTEDSEFILGGPDSFATKMTIAGL